MRDISHFEGFLAGSGLVFQLHFVKIWIKTTDKQTF